MKYVTKILIFIIISYGTLIGCGKSSAMNDTFLDNLNWRLFKVILDDKKFSFSVPKNQWHSGTLVKENTDEIPLDFPELLKAESMKHDLYSGVHAFGKATFKQPEGELDFNVYLGRTLEGNEINILSLSNLADAIFHKKMAYAKFHFNEKIKAGTYALPKATPFKEVIIKDRPWLYYSNEDGRVIMSTPINKDFYLYITFNLSLNKNSKYFLKANSIQQSIMESIALK